MDKRIAETFWTKSFPVNLALCDCLTCVLAIGVYGNLIFCQWPNDGKRIMRTPNDGRAVTASKQENGDLRLAIPMKAARIQGLVFVKPIVAPPGDSD